MSPIGDLLLVKGDSPEKQPGKSFTPRAREREREREREQVLRNEPGHRASIDKENCRQLFQIPTARLESLKRIEI